MDVVDCASTIVCRFVQNLCAQALRAQFPDLSAGRRSQILTYVWAQELEHPAAALQDEPAVASPPATSAAKAQGLTTAHDSSSVQVRSKKRPASSASPLPLLVGPTGEALSAWLDAAPNSSQTKRRAEGSAAVRSSPSLSTTSSRLAFARAHKRRPDAVASTSGEPAPDAPPAEVPPAEPTADVPLSADGHSAGPHMAMARPTVVATPE